MKIEEFLSIPSIDPGKSYDPAVTRDHEFNIIVSMLKPGVRAEFGVFQARSLNYAASLEPHITWYGFDSFVGLPEDWKINDPGKAQQLYVKKERFKLDKPPEVVSNVSLQIGWFEDTIPKFLESSKEPFALINIDCDLYSSTKTILDSLNDYIVPGTILRFDELCDWRYLLNEYHIDSRPPRKKYTSWEEGEWKALNEWLDIYNRKVEPLFRNWQFGATVRVLQ